MPNYDSVEKVIEMCKNNHLEDKIQEIIQAQEKAQSVITEDDYIDFFSKDLSPIQDNRGLGTIYAVEKLRVKKQ